MNSAPIVLGVIFALMAPPGNPPVMVSFSSKLAPGPISGRVMLIASRQEIRDNDPPPRLNWFKPYPFFAQDVERWPADETRSFRPTVGSPNSWDKLPPEKVYLQAVLDRDLGGMNYYSSPGNLYSRPVAVDLTQPLAGPVQLQMDRMIGEKKFPESARVKSFEIESKLLSDFHGKPIRLRAGIVLPRSYAGDTQKKYPVVYEIPGFGGDHFAAKNAEARGATDVGGIEMLYAVLDPSCRLGHHVFADSANNGPYGRALVEEFIPQLEARYRGFGIPGARFVTGHSSGGWSSLWLQVRYPDFFGGVWSTSPDPVDFRDFQRINLYGPAPNLFVDAEGMARPLARQGKKVLITFQPFSDMEAVMGRGGQLSSFEAVFSPRGPDGRPTPLWDRFTGKIDPEVAKRWQRYDIRLILENNWATLGPKLAGKIHVFMGDEDTFYLEGATRLLQRSLRELGSDAVVEIFAKKDHSNLVDSKLRERIGGEMAARFEQRPAVKLPALKSQGSP